MKLFLLGALTVLSVALLVTANMMHMQPMPYKGYGMQSYGYGSFTTLF